MSAAAEHRADDRAGSAEVCREAARALAPYSRCDGGLTVSGSATAALAELFRRLARDGDEVPEVAVRAARRLLADLDAAASPATATATAAPAPRAPADRADTALASR